MMRPLSKKAQDAFERLQAKCAKWEEEDEKKKKERETKVLLSRRPLSPESTRLSNG